MQGGVPLTPPSLAEIEHAPWPDLKRMCAELGLNPKGRSEIVRLRVLDHVRRRSVREAWRAGPDHQAALLVRLGFPESASRLWEPAIRLDAPAPWVGLGAARLGAGELEEAVKALDHAAQMGDSTAHLHKAEAFAAAGDFPGAVLACDAYLALRPGDLRGLATKAAFLGREGWSEQAAAELRSALEAHPEAKEVWRGLGVHLLKAGRYGAAAEAFHEATRADPRDVEAWANRGTALLLGGRHREAIGAYREALEIDPARADALNNLGVAYSKTGQAKSAAVNLERAARHLETPQILLNVAHVREAAHRKAEAILAYDRALKLSPRDAAAAAGRKRLVPKAMPRKSSRPARKPRTARPKPAEPRPSKRKARHRATRPKRRPARKAPKRRRVTKKTRTRRR